MEEERLTELDNIIISELEYLNKIPKDDERHDAQMKLICQLLEKKIEEKKIDCAVWEFEEKQNLEKKKQKIEYWKLGIEGGKVVLIAGTFLILEAMAHTRDILDVIPKDSLHIKNNPVLSIVTKFIK